MYDGADNTMRVAPVQIFFLWFNDWRNFSFGGKSRIWGATASCAALCTFGYLENPYYLCNDNKTTKMKNRYDQRFLFRSTF